MNDNDWAIIVGVSVYPGISNLDGPENDASAFEEWVRSPTGGTIDDKDAPADEKRVHVFLSSMYLPPPFPSAKVAKPTVEMVENTFDDLDDRANTREKAGLDRQIGRRLSITMAGHGF